MHGKNWRRKRENMIFPSGLKVAYYTQRRIYQVELVSTHLLIQLLLMFRN